MLSSSSFSRSVLFTTAIHGVPFSSSKSSMSSSLSFDELSKTAKTSPQFFILSFALETPICSTLLSVSLIPAVSLSLKITSPKTTVSSMISLVVPGISVTMLFSQPARRFIIVDFPTFGLPTITVSIPSFTACPTS